MVRALVKNWRESIALRMLITDQASAMVDKSIEKARPMFFILFFPRDGCWYCHFTLALPTFALRIDVLDMLLPNAAVYYSPRVGQRREGGGNKRRAMCL